MTTAYDDYGIPVGAYREPEGLVQQAWRVMRAIYLYRIRHIVKRWEWRRVCSVANALVVVWWVVLYWGERGVFDEGVKGCAWEGWEKWEDGANPHRLVFVADPQLIDPHTYPGRPWPLNPLTYKYTDLYLRRTFSRVQTILYPDTIFFLGDLFDGGREWSTRTTTSPEEQYHKYGDPFWMKEYKRFGDIFFRHWGDGGLTPRPGQPGRKLISSLPGNHDLGFARGVQLGVRDRFNAYFGDSNRIDIIANHTFVSIDALSLSALDQDSPNQVESLWRPTLSFLESAQKHRTRLTQRELRKQQGLTPYPRFPHATIPSEQLSTSPSPLPHSDVDAHPFPTILLSHIPLYRPPNTPCGPLREHSPPDPLNPSSPRNALPVSAGYQYQTVLSEAISKKVTSAIGDVRYAFSGDDHDYCDVVHRAYDSGGGNGIREVTVKSTSWAMGMRKPGIVLLSLWNPVTPTGKPIKPGSEHATVQIKLCLYPDQIGIFIRYGILFGFTVLAIIAAGVIELRRSGNGSSSEKGDQGAILPIARGRDGGENGNGSVSSAKERQGGARTRNSGVQWTTGGEQAEYKTVKVYGGGSANGKGKGKRRNQRKGVELFLYGFRWRLSIVLFWGGLWYLGLVWWDRE
ncbi:hypothetical protein GQ44DRAFT_616424 [Phaeosphaeriaceae sp. PMI808]|nr:hypothetical protein GQ44DRAFT_616424 [Phaeosphaeriaceae sp. PMI808]